VVTSVLLTVCSDKLQLGLLQRHLLGVSRWFCLYSDKPHVNQQQLQHGKHGQQVNSQDLCMKRLHAALQQQTRPHSGLPMLPSVADAITYCI